MGRDDERDLLEAIRAGRRDAAEALVRLHHGAVYRFLFHLARDHDRADDLTQETFATAWRRIGGFRGHSTLATWLHRIAFTRYVDARRGRRRNEAALAEIRRGVREPDAVDPAGSLLLDERSRQLAEAVEALDEPERIAVVLHYLQGLSLREVAEVVRRPVGTVKWRTSRALGRLRELLEEDRCDEGRASIAASGLASPGIGPPRPPASDRP